MAFAASHPQLWAQEVTSEAPSQAVTVQTSKVGQALPDSPGAVRYPEAEVVPPEDDRDTVTIESNEPQRKTGNVYTADDHVVITYRNHVVYADHIVYDSDTNELTATGHLRVVGGKNNEDFTASHGRMNVVTQTGRFYDVNGSVGMKAGMKLGGTSRETYVNSNPFLFMGRMVEKTGPEEYTIYDGKFTSCMMPHPDWLLSAGKFHVGEGRASAQNSIFHVVGLPLLYLPYVTHPVEADQRQSGIEIPEFGNSSTKGVVLGETFYWAINRSMDLTVGLDYFSRRGWSERSTFQYKGVGNDFVRAHYSGLQDRGYMAGNVYVNQGGQDIAFSGRHDFSRQTRVAGFAEYLSSYPYRQAFAEDFNEAVSSDIVSTIYAVHQWDGYSAGVRVERYQGLKMAATAKTPEEEVRIFHVPSLEFSSTEHEIGRTGLQWNLVSSMAGLSRVQPDFSTGGLTQRFDFHPQISYPLSFDGWHLRGSLGVRDTLYSRSKEPTNLGGLPVELSTSLNRADVEMEAELRAPVVERTFDSPGVERFFHHDVRHTIEPEFAYRYVTGVSNFQNVLRFDDVDVASNTNEVEYGVTQRLFLRPLKAQHCAETEEKVEKEQAKIKDTVTHLSMRRTSGCGNQELISWRVTQKYFLDSRFGGAVVDGRRNIFDTTLNLSGIAFLTEPREISPLVSRLRVRTSANMDVEWDFDLDTGAKKFTSNNVVVDVHQGNVFGGLSYARLNAPGRFYTEGATSSVSNFNQLRLLLGYGSPTKEGLSVAANVGLDLNSTGANLVQYGALQTSYNWNCCGFSVEYRKYELGSVRNESAEKFSITLVNLGTAGNLRSAASLF